MMRRGPLADNPIEALLDAAARERISGVIELHAATEGRVFLIEGEIYFAELSTSARLGDRLMEVGLLTSEQVARHTEAGDEEPYLALALDTDPSIDDQAVGAWLFDVTAAALARFVGASEGEYELDPYGTHPVGILASWTPDEVFERMQELRAEAERREAERLEAERVEAERVEAERVEAERLEAERLEAERLEAERLEAERLEQERIEAERLEAERDEQERIAQEAAAAEEAERVAEEQRLADEQAEAERKAVAEADAGEAEATGEADADDQQPTSESGEAPADQADETPTGDDDAATPSSASNNDESDRIVAVEAPPNGLIRIELNPTEWRVVIAASQGISRDELAAKLSLDANVASRVVSMLCDRGLLSRDG